MAIPSIGSIARMTSNMMRWVVAVADRCGAAVMINSGGEGACFAASTGSDGFARLTH